MRAVAAAIVAASVLGGGSAGAGCPAGNPGRCVDLDLVPQISQQIVGSEPLVAPPKEAPVTDQQPGYTGPIVGTAMNLRRAPTVGYRWAIK